MAERRFDDELAIVRRHFKQAGLRWTKQRQCIVAEVFATHEHFSAEALLSVVQEREGGHGVHLATVYRTLQVLEEGGFIEGLDVGQGGRLFEHVLGHAHHDHVICTDCGRILEFADAAMERRKGRAAHELGFEMTSHSLRIYGACLALRTQGRCEHLTAAPAGRARVPPRRRRPD
jgi:Fur family ferric uptake transcriptional regulator